MAIAALAIGNLTTTALYVSSFHVEVFSDAAYTNLVSSQSCPAVKNSAGNWTQSEMISVTGLLRGNTYYIQAGPVSPGGAANFSRYSIQAGVLTIPACTYGGNFTATSSGITYDILPASVPSDIDHFEAIWTKDGSAPSNSSLENFWEGQALPNGYIHIWAGGAPGQTIHLFFRAVSLSGGYQNWYAVDNRMVTAAGSYTGTTSAAGITYADGTTVQSLQPGQAGADKTSINTAADTAAVNGINSGHVADTATSIGFLGKWWRASASVSFPAGFGEMNTQPMFTTHDAFINYNIFNYASFAGSIQPPTFAPYGPNNDGKYIYVRWTGFYVCPSSGTYTFGTNCDDGANLYVNGTRLVSDMVQNAGHGANSNLQYQHSGTIALVAGNTYEIIVEYYNQAGGAGIQVMYTPPGGVIQILNLGTAFKNATFLQYSNGQTVDSLQPAAAGADVTSVNISADTSSVGGRSAADVASTVLAGSGINYLGSGNINTPQNANNLLVRGDFNDGSTGTWGPGAGISTVSGQTFTKAMSFIGRDTFEFGNSFSVLPGSRIYCSAWIDTTHIPSGYANVGFGVATKDASGSIIGFFNAVVTAPGLAWHLVSAYITIPSNAVYAIPWLQIDHDPSSLNYSYYANIASMFYAKSPAVDFSDPTHTNKNADNIPYTDGTSIQALKPAQVGADVTGANTANNTNNVASVPATTIASVIPNGYKLYINSGSRQYSITAI